MPQAGGGLGLMGKTNLLRDLTAQGVVMAQVGLLLVQKEIGNTTFSLACPQ